MTSPRLACALTILTSVLILAQFMPVSPATQLNELPPAQKSHPGVSQNRRLAQWSHFASGAPVAVKFRSPKAPALSFADAVTYNSGGFSTLSKGSVAVGDVNGDGKADMVVSNNCDTVNDCSDGLAGVLLGNGDGTFQPAVTYSSGGVEAASVALADVNGDGKLDILVANYCASTDSCLGTVGVLLGNGDGTFQAPVTYGSGGGSSVSIAVADVNRDGKPDILVENYCFSSNNCNTGGVGVLLGNGDGTFQPAVSYESGGAQGTSVAVADVNEDGKPDLLVANCGSVGNSCIGTGTVGVLLGNGDGTFQSVVTYGSGGSNAQGIAVADLNGDGKPDLLAANECVNNTDCPNGSIGVLLGNGDGTFQAASVYNSGGLETFSVTAADVNGDGKPDLLVASECLGGNCVAGAVGVLLGNGDGTFQTAVGYASGGGDAYSIAAADVNGDGKPDLLVANACAGTGCNVGIGLVGVLINTSIGPTTTTLTSSQNPSDFGQVVSFTATVSTQGFGRPPTGTVIFFDNNKDLGDSQLNQSGVATLATSMLSVGRHSITAIYYGDANFSSSDSPILNQVVQGAIALLSPTKLSFGNQTVGIPSTPQNVTLQNKGNINLAISLIETTGPNAGDFPETNNCPALLAPNSSCTIKVTFKPSAAGTRNAALSVTDNAPGSPQSASLTGVGVIPGVMLSPSSLTFATQVVYSTSPAQKVTLTNTGLGILEITSAKISGQFGVTTNCGETLAPGASCTANVTFKPRAKGPLSGSISITDNALDSPQSVPLSGVGTFVQLTPSSLNFGSQPVNTTSVPKYVTLVNKGDATVNFTGSGITIAGADPGDFAQQNNCGSSVPSGGNCRIKVTFTPTQQGKRTADVSISDDGGGSPQTVPLAGTGTP